MTIPACVVVLFWSGLCAADQRAIASRQLHQPIVAAVVAGWILGEPGRGLLVGLWMQLVWATPMPIGGSVLPDMGSAAVAAAVIACAVPGGVGLLVALLVGLLLAAATIPWERALRAANGAREDEALACSPVRLTGAIALGVLGPFLRGVICVAIAVLLARAVAPWVGRLPQAEISDALTKALVGGAAAVGLANLLAGAQKEGGARWYGWVAGGLLIGAGGRLLLGVWR